MSQIPVVDIFAGPGGLGEGFSSFSVDKFRPFDIKMSVEKDPDACRTLKLRSFFKKVHFGLLKPHMIKFLKSKRTIEDEQQLYSNFELARDLAEEEVLCKELGRDSFPQEVIDRIIKIRINGSKNWVLIGGPPARHIQQ